MFYYPPQAPNQYAQYPGGLAPQEMQQLQAWFAAVDCDRTGFVDAPELQKALSAAGNSFDLGVAKVLVKMFDKKNLGKIDFTDFIDLHKFIMTAKETFHTHDIDHDGRVTIPECHKALQRFQFNLTDQTLKANMMMVDKNLRGSLDFTEFMQMLVSLGHARHIFELYCPPNQRNNPNATINVNLDLLCMMSTLFRA
eukprot:ANDGO_01083.mRNA.1 Penta-EF hand domain-containing protein 1